MELSCVLFYLQSQDSFYHTVSEKVCQIDLRETSSPVLPSLKFHILLKLDKGLFCAQNLSCFLEVFLQGNSLQRRLGNESGASFWKLRTDLGREAGDRLRRADFALLKKDQFKTLNVTAKPQNLKSESPQQMFNSVQLEKGHRPGFKYHLHLFLAV